jgi:hypothetical protein
MATVGDTIILLPNEKPPAAPSGTHWVVTEVVASETGGAWVWKLVADVPSALQDSWERGLDALFNALAASSSGSAGSFGGTRAINFCNGALIATPMSWLSDDNYNLVGAHVPSGWNVTISISGKTNIVTSGTTSINFDVLLATTSTTQGMIGAIPFVPVAKNTTLYVWFGAANGSCTVYLQKVAAQA